MNYLESKQRVSFFSLKFFILAIVFFVASGIAQAADTIKVGVLHSLSGTMAISETSLKDVALMAIEEINAAPSSEKKTLALNSTNDELALYRETLRDTLKAADLNLPCLGPISFNNAGHNKSPRFEIVSPQDGELQIITTQEFVDLAKKKIDLSLYTFTVKRLFL